METPFTNLIDRFETLSLIIRTNWLAYELSPHDGFIVWMQVGDEKQPRCADNNYRTHYRDKDGYGYKVTYLDSLYHRSYNTALSFLFNNRKRYQGLGFVLRRPYEQNCAYTCVDLDWKKRTPQQPSPFQIALIQACIDRTYIEWSPSGMGVHIWFKGSSGGNRKQEGIEIYTHARFLTLTFVPYENGNVPVGDWNRLFQTLPLDVINIVNSKQHSCTLHMPTGGEMRIDVDWLNWPPEPLTPDDLKVLEMGAHAKNGSGARFKALYRGDWQDRYKSQSDADLAFINMLALYTNYNVEQTIRIFHNSKLGQRGKAYRPDYLRRTIARAFDRRLPAIPIGGK